MKFVSNLYFWSPTSQDLFDEVVVGCELNDFPKASNDRDWDVLIRIHLTPQISVRDQIFSENIFYEFVNVTGLMYFSSYSFVYTNWN